MNRAKTNYINCTNIDAETITELEKKVKCQWDTVCISLILKSVMIAKTQMVIVTFIKVCMCVFSNGCYITIF